MLRRMTLAVLMLCAVGMAIGVQAQEAPVATVLNNPRHLRFGDDGTLYIAEAGFGGDQAVPSPAGGGESRFGLTARVSTTTVPDGEQGVLIDGLLSNADAFGASEGVADVLVTADSAWLVLGQGPTPENIPADAGGVMTAVIQVDLATLETVKVLDLYTFELENNPDGGEIASNPQEIALLDDGTLLIVDASANALLSWTEADGLAVVAVWEVDSTGATPQPVPSSLAVGPDGSIYVGFLSGFPFAEGSAKIERWLDGELVETFAGLTMVTDVAVGQDGNLYAVQFAGGFGDTGYIPDSGSVVQVSADGITPIMTGLNFPYGIAQHADGDWYVTINSAFTGEGTGAVVKVVEGAVPAPVETPEA